MSEKLLRLGYCSKCRKLFKQELLKKVVFVELETLSVYASSIITYENLNADFLCQSCYDEVNKNSEVENNES